MNFIFRIRALLCAGLCFISLGCASSGQPVGDWAADDLIRLKEENAKYKEQLKVARLQIHHLERRGKKFKAFEDQIFLNIQESYKAKHWELLRTQVDQVLKDFPSQDQRVVRSVFYLAELSRQLGHDTHALQAYDWLHRNPASGKYKAGTYLGMGLVYGQMGLHKEAQNYFSLILEKHPNSSEAVLASREISDLTHLRSTKGKTL